MWVKMISAGCLLRGDIVGSESDVSCSFFRDESPFRRNNSTTSVEGFNLWSVTVDAEMDTP